MSITYNWFIHNGQQEETWAYRPTFTKEQCDAIIKHGLSLQLQHGTVGGKEQETNVDFSIRKSRISWIPSNNPETQWIFRTCTDMINDLNGIYFNFDLLYIESLQFTMYDGTNSESSFYGKHIDTAFRNNGSRKLSFSILLSDEQSFVGGDLLLHLDKDSTPAVRKQGTAVAFPSNTLHEVTPVTSGVRYSLVGWVVGPRFK